MFLYVSDEGDFYQSNKEPTEQQLKEVDDNLLYIYRYDGTDYLFMCNGEWISVEDA